MAASTKPATSTGGKDKDDLAEKLKNLMKQCCYCWNRKSNEECCNCFESNEDKNNPAGSKGSEYRVYATPKSDLDDLPGKKDQGEDCSKDQDTAGDSGGYKEGVKETTFSTPEVAEPPLLLPVIHEC